MWEVIEPKKHERTMSRTPRKCAYCGQQHGTGSPFYNKAKDCWSITVADGQNRMLAKGFDSHDRAMQLWHESKSLEQAPETLIAKPEPSTVTVVEILDRYLISSQDNKKTFKVAQFFLSAYAKRFGNWSIERMKTEGLGATITWLKGQTTWQSGSKELFCKKLKAAFNLAAKTQLIEFNPLKLLNTGRNRDKAKTRETFFTDEQLKKLFDAIGTRGATAKLAFKVLLETGCRPSELCNLTAADVKIEDGLTYWLVDHKNKKKTGKKRKVYMMTTELENIISEQCKKHPAGAIFRNAWGSPWTPDALGERLRETLQRIGLDEHQLINGRKEYKYVVYTFRHTFAFRCVGGHYKGKPLPYAQIADLMGNSALEVEKTYGHIEHTTPKLVAQLKS
jgi:integrase